MDQTLDMQVAALIFLAGTRCLVTSDPSGEVETTTEKEDSEEPAPIPPIAIDVPYPRPYPSVLG